MRTLDSQPHLDNSHLPRVCLPPPPLLTKRETRCEARQVFFTKPVLGETRTGWGWNCHPFNECTYFGFYTTYDIRQTTCDMRHTTYDIRHMTYDIRHTTYDIRHTTYDIFLPYDTYYISLYISIYVSIYRYQGVLPGVMSALRRRCSPPGGCSGQDARAAPFSFHFGGATPRGRSSRVPKPPSMTGGVPPPWLRPTWQESP